MKTQEIFFALVRHALFGTEVSADTLSALTPEALARVERLAAAHDLAHLVAHALSSLGILGKDATAKKLSDALFLSVFRYERLAHACRALCDTLKEANIPFLPLKGAVIRDLYPEGWMRTSCDIDILVKEDDLSLAVDTIMSRLSYTSDKKKSYHDVSLYSPNGIHLELHFNIREDNAALDGVLTDVWDHAAPIDGARHALSTEFLFFHVTAHMAYHFLGGGCGIRPLIDLFLMQRKLSPDKAVLERLLERAGLTAFYREATSLAEVWMTDAPHTPLTRGMEAYILHGGVYGTLDSSVAIKKMRRGGRLRYLFYRIFPPRRSLKITYPILEKHPALTPLMWGRRWFRFLFRTDKARVGAELKFTATENAEKTAAVRELLTDLELL